MRILIAGSEGLVGKTLTERFLQQDKHTIIPLSRKEFTDFRDQECINQFIMNHRPEVLYMVAANGAEARGQVSPIDMTENNLGIFLNVLVPAINAGVKHVVYISSIAVYGHAETFYAEEDATNPVDVYGVNKLACEQILKVLASVHGFTYTIVRPHNIYGPHQDMSNPYKNVVAMFMRSLFKGEQIILYSDGEMVRQFSYVDDVVDVLMRCVDKVFKNKTYNLGSSQVTTIKELLQVLEKVTGIYAKTVTMPARKQELFMFCADHPRLTKELYKETPLEEGLKKTWEFITKQPLPDLRYTQNEIE